MSGKEENKSAGAAAAEEEAIPSTSTRIVQNTEMHEELPSTSTRPAPHSELQTTVQVAATGSELKELLGEADLQLKAYGKHEGAVFIETPAFKACQKKLEKGGVTIVGASGDGKTTIAKELLLRQTKRQAVIIADEDDWKKVYLAEDENLIILFDDMLGKFVSNKKTNWETKLDKICDAVRSGKIQVVITCRETVLSRCREQIEHFELFKPENRVHLSGPNSTCNLDTDTKRKMIQKHINSMSNISVCDKLDDENLYGDERKISSKSLDQIALKNCPGFPQCCYTFVSMPTCFTRGDTFFDNPTKCLITEIDRMRTSVDKIDQFNYCTLVSVLFYEELTDDTIEKHLETIQLIAESCGINTSSATLHSKIRLAASRLSTSYLVGTCDTGHTFQHNSLLQSIFTSFFKSQPKLLIEHCEFNLIKSLVTTEQATEKSDLFYKIQGGTQTDCLCSRLATEIMASNVIEAVGHRSLTDPVFIGKFFSHIKKSSNKKTVLQSTQYNESILYWAAGLSDKCFVERLLTEMKSVMFVNRKARMGKKMSRALCGACRYGNYRVFTLLVSRPGVKVFDTCLCGAARGGHDRIVTELLSVKKWSTHHVTRALYEACSKGSYDMYRSLITYDATAIDVKCLCEAARSKNDRIVTELLSVKKWSTRDATHALYMACLHGRYDVYRSLITYDVTAIDGQCLRRAVSGRDNCIVTDLLSVKKWSTRHVTWALYEACSKGSYDMCRSLITHDVTAIDDKCLCEAASGGDVGIATELLSAKRWSTHHVTWALYKACSKGSYDMYRSLITYDVTAIDDKCLCEAASGGDVGIVTELLSVKKWSTRHVTQALYEAFSNGRYDMYRSLIRYDVTAIDDQCLWMAASGGDDRIMTELLSVKKWSTHDVTQALYRACSCGRYGVFRSLITYDVTAKDDDCLCEAASGGDDRIVTELLSVKKWSTCDVTQALYKACFYGRYDVYISLITYDVTAIDEQCLLMAAIGGDDRIVTELLSVKKWSTRDVTQALYKACFYGRYDVYISLITYDVTAIDEQCLWWAASGGDDRIVTKLLSVKKWSTCDATHALYTACSNGRYDMYRSLIRYNVAFRDDGYLCWAASSVDDRIITDMLSDKNWSTHHVTQALYEACSEGIYDAYRSLITYDVAAIDDTCLWRAASGGDDRIVRDLLSVNKWSTHHVTLALYKACSEGRYDVYRSLITYDVTAIDGECLCEAARGGDDRIVSELLSVKKWFTHDVTQALYQACSKGRDDMYRSLMTYDVTAIGDECLFKAATGGHDRIVTKLLSVKKWSTLNVTRAICEACSWGSFDMYISLITHDVTAIDEKCLRYADFGRNIKIKDDLLSKGYKLPNV